MPFAHNGLISQSPIEGSIEITAAQYADALSGMLAGRIVTIDEGFAVVDPPSPPDPEPESELTFEQQVDRKLNQLSARRYQAETGGILFAGIPIRTDRETSAILTAARVLAVEDPNFTVPNWKAANGVFVPLDATTIIAVADAVRQHVQSTFDHEALLSAQILAAEDEEALEAVDIEAGWPE